MNTKIVCIAAMVLVAIPALTWADSTRETWGLYNSGDYKSSYDMALPLANQGDVEAQYLVGSIFGAGLGVPKDYTQAVFWFKKAAQQQHMEAEFWCGFSYMHGLGVEKNYDEAKVWFRRAAEQGHPKAFHNLAALALGSFMTVNLLLNDNAREEALLWFVKGAKHGDFLSQYGAGLMYRTQSRDSNDEVQAYYWMSRAAKYDLSGEDSDLRQFKVRAEEALRKYRETMSASVIAEAERLLAE